MNIWIQWVYNAEYLISLHIKIIYSDSTKYLSGRLHYDFSPKSKICPVQIEIEDTFAKSTEKIIAN